MSKKIVVLLFVFIGLLQSCNTTEPPLAEKVITLTLEDASSIEAWVTLTTNNLQLPATITLKQSASGGNAVTQDIILSYADTVIYIDSLLPNTNYNFQASIIQSPVSSNKLIVTTMDTTSHNFSFETFTFGTIGSSVLRDVAIIDENNIWAVGEIYLNDSLGNPDPNAYNAIHWDGNSWALKRIYFPTICGQTSLTPYPAKAVFAFDNEIWISSTGDKIAKLKDGVQFFNGCLPWSFSINKIWGTSSSDLYVVGNNGNIAWYNGSVWTRIESGTDLMLRDITGESTAGEKWFSGYNSFGSHHSILIQLKNLSPSVVWESQNLIDTPPYGLTIESIYAFNDLLFVASNEGIFRKNTRLDLPPQKLASNPIKRYRISGSGQNDVYTVGSNSVIIHYNGMSWERIYENYQNTSVLYSAATRNNTTVSVGTIVIDAVYHRAQIILSTNF